METRLEHDAVGAMRIPAQAYYGVQTLRAVQNFPMTGNRMHPLLIDSLVLIKKAAARCNLRASVLDKNIAVAIERACDEILQGKLRDFFLVDPIQGGAGTSANMNANEVIANRAIELMGGVRGDYSIVHPNDHVNLSQSTNDVFPTAGKITALRLLEQTEQAVMRLTDAFSRKANEFDHVLKPGRTQLQDAVPLRMGQSFSAYASALRRCANRLHAAQTELTAVNMGGTAIGTGINAPYLYFESIVPTLSQLTGLSLRQAADLIDGTQHVDGFLAVSGALKSCAMSMSKIANDLRLLSSGPRTGLSEINLPPMQNGSSIMPGKINPVIPEVVTQAAFRVAGNDQTIAMAVEAGQLELNAFEPVLFYSLFESMELIARAADTFRENCVTGISANETHCRELLDQSACSATALCPHIGYERAARIAKTALRQNRTLEAVARETLNLPVSRIRELLDPEPLTHVPGEETYLRQYS